MISDPDAMVYPTMTLIVLQEKAGPLECELAEAVRQVIDTDGGRVRIVEEQDAAGHRADLLLLMSDCASYRSLPSAQGLAGSRPRTVLWQMHPLPPAALPPDAERLGLRAARWQRHRSPDRGWNRVGHEARKLIGGRLFEECRRRILSSEQWPWPELETASVRAMMRRWAVLRRWWDSNRLDQVCVSTPDRQLFLASRGIVADLAPVGWHPVLGDDAGGTRDLDVVFLGRLNRRGRQTALQTIERELRTAGKNLTVVEKDCYGMDRQRLLNRAKVVLNLNKFPWDTPWIRLMMALGCGAAVVSEPLEGVFTDSLRAGEHFVAADPSALAGAALRLLSDEPRRRTMVSAAQAWMAAHLTLRQSVRTLLVGAASDTLGT